jgi:hypothetical protein
MREILQAFSVEQEQKVQELLQSVARFLRNMPGGGKMEENYWSHIYCTAKGLPVPGWSNLGFNDLLCNGLGVESKVLQRSKPFDDIGKCLMHPAATRKLNYDPTKPAEECKNAILKQWNDAITEFQSRVCATSSDGKADVRWGILLWATDLGSYLYFEERLVPVDPKDFHAQWVDAKHRGKAIRNLHIFENETKTKRYSVTLPSNGAKLQPYFDIPDQNHGAHLFQVDAADYRPIWIKADTFELLRNGLGDKTADEFLVEVLAMKTAAVAT